MIGWALGVAASTVHAVLRRHGRSRLATRSTREEIIRYERSRPGELVHVDAKKLGRIIVGFYAAHGICVERVLTDNGTCFKRRWSDACASHGIVVRKTRPYRPQTNGKAERFIRTLIERWAYAYPYERESERLAVLPTDVVNAADRRPVSE